MNENILGSDNFSPHANSPSFGSYINFSNSKNITSPYNSARFQIKLNASMNSNPKTTSLLNENNSPVRGGKKNLMVKRMATIEGFNEEEIQHITNLFLLLDHENKGIVLPNDIIHDFNTYKIFSQDDPLFNILKQVLMKEEYSNGMNIKQFISAISTEIFLNNTRDYYFHIFRCIDIERTGTITINSLDKISSILGEGLTKDEIKKMISAVSGNSKVLTFDQFYNIMTKNNEKI